MHMQEKQKMKDKVEMEKRIVTRKTKSKLNLTKPKSKLNFTKPKSLDKQNPKFGYRIPKPSRINKNLYILIIYKNLGQI